MRRHAEPAAAREVAAARGGSHAEEGGGDDDEELKFSEEVDGEGALMPREAAEAGDAADAADAADVEARPAPLAIGAAAGGQAAGGVPRSATAFAQYEALV